MHSEFVSEFIVQSNHDTSTLEITFSSTQNLYCSYHRIKNCPTLEIGVRCIQNLHVNSQYGQIMTTLPQILLFAVHTNIIRYLAQKKFEFHAGVKKIFSNFSSMFLNPHKFFKFGKEYSLMKFVHKVPLLRPTAFSSR